MPSIIEIAWAAGFLEGEGWFGCAGKNSLAITASQVQEEPLHRLSRIFGGNVHGPHLPKKQQSNHNPHFNWAKCGHGAAGIMMTIFCLMSPKRKIQIRTALDRWRIAAGPTGFRHFCPSGHEYSGKNLGFVKRNGRDKPNRICKTCSRAASKKYAEKKVVESNRALGD